MTCRGIPHNLIPGIHKALDAYVDGLENLRCCSGRENSNTVDSIMALPFSAWSQALPPTIEATADVSLRMCVRDPHHSSLYSGRAYLTDSTHEDEAIVREPLFRRPCQTSVADNPFSTALANVDTFFNCVNLIAGGFCRAAFPNEAPSAMTTKISNWIDADETDEMDETDETDETDNEVDASVVFALDTLLALAVCYPFGFEVGADCILPTWALTEPIVLRRVHQGHGDLRFDHLGLSAEAKDMGRQWWHRFVRPETGLWVRGPEGASETVLGPLGRLIDLLNTNDGSHSVTRSLIAEVRDALELSVQAAWCVASSDGVTPPPDDHPASTCKRASSVRRPHIDPIFVGDESNGVAQRGALIGLKPNQMRQIAALALGAHLPGVDDVQVARNEGMCTVRSNPTKLHISQQHCTVAIPGGLSLRISSAADILSRSGEPRSAKSISPVQTEMVCTVRSKRASWTGGVEISEKRVVFSPISTDLHP